MKRVLVLTGCAAMLLASSLLLVPTASASAGHRITYAGRTAQDRPIRLGMVKTGDVIRWTQVDIGTQLTCEDSTQQDWGFFIGYFPGARLQDGSLAFDSVDDELGFHIHGHFGSKAGAGKIQITVPELTADEHAQSCTTGALGFRVHRVHRHISSPSAGRPDRHYSARRGTIDVKIWEH